jgi:hypothetical protein
MKTVLGGIVFAVVLTVVAGYLLPRAQEPAYRAFATQSVRIGNPGTNLVGPTWSGEGQVPPPGKTTATSSTGSSHE